MTTKNGVKLYINSVRTKINATLRDEVSYMKDLQINLKRLKKQKSLNSSDKLRVKYLSKEIRELKAKITTAREYKKNLTFEMVSNNLKKLKKHPHIIGVEAGEKEFKIYTKPLKVSGKKIGYYEIELSYKYPASIYIYNLYKRKVINGCSYDHWFIRSGKPCLGSWRKVLIEYLYSGNIYLGVDTIIQFLTSGNRSHEGYTTFKKFILNYS